MTDVAELCERADEIVTAVWHSPDINESKRAEAWIHEAAAALSHLSAERDADRRDANEAREAKWKAEAALAEARTALAALLNTTPEERQNPAIWFPRVDAARAALEAKP